MSPWDALGLAPTADARAIRRAYAARLKALDPDDRDGFVALRDALDAANDWWWDEDEYAEIQEQDGELDDDLPVTLLPASHDLSGRSEPIEPDTPAWHAEADAIAALAWAEPSADNGARDAEMIARAERLLASSALEEIATGQAVEDWLVWLIVEAMPRADALIEPGLHRFGWDRQALDWNSDWSVRQVMQRRADVAWLARQPVRSMFGQGWAMLRDPERFAPRARDAGPVEATLHEIDAHRPTLRADLEEEGVAAWEALLDERRARPVARARRRARAAGATVGGKLLPVLEWLMTGWRGAVLWVGLVIGMMALVSSMWMGLVLAWSVIGAIHLFAWLGRR